MVVGLVANFQELFTSLNLCSLISMHVCCLRTHWAFVCHTGIDRDHVVKPKIRGAQYWKSFFNLIYCSLNGEVVTAASSCVSPATFT